jgi:glycerophosphoryl diester phosphodiesterase
MRFVDTPTPRLFAHRGASGLRPENTLESFAAGLEDGARILELDVHASSDGHVVVFHDEVLDRTTDGRGPLAARTLNELRQLDAGYRYCDPEGDFPYRGKGIRIPTLSELLHAFPDTPLNVEIKQLDPPIENAVLALLDEFDARERVLLAAGDDRIMARIRAAAPNALTSFASGEVADFLTRTTNDALDGYTPPGFALQIPRFYQGIELVSAATVSAAHELGIEVHVWTVNEEHEMEALLDLGVDGIMSDFPGRVSYIFHRRGLGQRTRGLD